MHRESALHASTRSSAQLDGLDTLATCPPLSFSTVGSKVRARLRGASYWASKFDVVSVLGGEGEDGHGPGLGTYGHTGCINALDWSSDGTTLASGSDDTRACIWKLGQEPDNTFADNADVVQRYSGLGMGLSSIIHTGHRANIFSVKFAPGTTNVLFTASGDHEARVFDLNQAASGAQAFSSPSPHTGAKREWSEYTKTSGVCTRVLKCHRGRVKRIATEGVSDAVFLTCSEDGTVRQHDLRVGHVCKRDCPPPLCSYREKGMGLYSLTTSVLRPELFVVAGTSPFAYLHDRRMVPRTMMEQWGVRASPTELTQCVRRFGPARRPLVPEPQSDDSDEDRENAEPRNHGTHAQRIQRLRERRARARSGDENHVTAAKLSNVNGRELLLTYSGGPVCLYDIFDNPESGTRREKSVTLETSRRNGKRKGEATQKEEVREKVGQPVGQAVAMQQPPNSDAAASSKHASDDAGKAVPTRRKLALPEPQEERSTQTILKTPQSDFIVNTLEEAPGLSKENQSSPESSEPMYTVTERNPEDQANNGEANSRQEILRTSLQRSPSPPHQSSSEERSVPAPSNRARNFEIRVGDDGNLEVEIDDITRAGENVPSDDEDDAELNTEGYQALLQNLAAAQAHAQESGDSEEDDTETDDEDVVEEDDTDNISSSDNPESAGEPVSRAGANGEVPLIRPQKIYRGHRNVDTVKDVNFGGMDNLVISGSDDGNVFIYDKETTDIIAIIKGDESVVNVMKYHPQLPIMAVSGIDNSAKILAPTTLGSPEGKVYLQRKFSRLAQKDEITQKNQDASWTSERLAMPPSILINLLNRAAAAGEEEEEGEGEPGSRRRIPLSALLQLAGEGDTDQDCNIM